MHWLSENYKWLFDGIGGLVLMAVIGYFTRRVLTRSRGHQKDAAAPTQTHGQEVPCCEFWLEFDGNDLLDDRSLRIQNTGNQAVFDVIVKIPADGSGFKSDVINRLDNDKSWIPCTSNGNPEYLRSLRAVLAETVLHHSGEGDIQTIPVLVSCRSRSKQSCEYSLEIRLPLRGGIQFAVPASHSGQEAPKQRAATQQGVEVEVAETSTSEQQDRGADADRKFARLAIDEARKSVPESDGRPHPWVGAVVVKDGKVLGTAHRGEEPGNHAEFVALERNLPTVAVAGATVYTTLEPCTTRNHPKIPCADRLIERRVARVVIGMLDPDERIRGKGQRKLSNAGIETSLFPHDLAMEVEELNREFTRFCEQRAQMPTPAPSSQKVEGAGYTKLGTILSYKGKVVTVVNRTKVGPHISESFWPYDTIVEDCNSLFVTLRNAGGPISFPLSQVDVNFDNEKNRLRLELDRY